VLEIPGTLKTKLWKMFRCYEK